MCCLFCMPKGKPLQNLTGPLTGVRHWSVLHGPRCQSDQTCLSAGFLLQSQKKPKQTVTEEETLPSPRSGQLALAAHHHVLALSTAATPRHPAGLQNDATLLARSWVSFSISTEAVAGSLGFQSVFLCSSSVSVRVCGSSLYLWIVATLSQST